MEKLEKEIINRLNKVLNGYNLEIISRNNHNYKTTLVIDYLFKHYCSKYVLAEIKDNTIINYYHAWDNIKHVLLGSVDKYSIFDKINTAHKNVKHHKDNGFETYESYILLDKLYNELHSLKDCSCLEELAIKMDLIEI